MISTTQAIAESGLRKPERFSVHGFSPFFLSGIAQRLKAVMGAWSDPAKIFVI